MNAQVTPLVPIALIAIATLHDLASREIPDWVWVMLLVWGLVVALFADSASVWTQAAVGGLLGFALTAPLFWLGGLGGGDVKLVAALGFCLGPGMLLVALFWTALAGGILALTAKLRGKSDFAYVPAILAGLVLTAIWPGALSYVLAR